ncbi:MAG: glycosyltransferase [Planctomycetota bacterium]
MISQETDPMPEPGQEAALLRVVHLGCSLGVGGVERWLLEVMRYHGRHYPGIQHVIIADGPRGQSLQDDFASVASRIVNPDHWGTRALLRTATAALHELGPFDLAHSHPFTSSGPLLRVASGCRVPVRVAHSHNTSSTVSRRHPRLWPIYARLAHAMIRRYATHTMACSDAAAIGLFGSTKGVRLLPYGVPIERFDRARHEPPPADLGDERFLATISRLTPQKNVHVLVELMAGMGPDAPRALIVGDGPERARIEKAIREHGLTGRVLLLGERGDVPSILTHNVAAMLMPSEHEGLPVAALEAQAAGVPLIVSESVTPQIEAVPGAVFRAELAAGAAAWIDVVKRALAESCDSLRASRVERFRGTPFTAQASAEHLAGFYCQVTGRSIQSVRSN